MYDPSDRQKDLARKREERLNDLRARRSAISDGGEKKKLSTLLVARGAAPDPMTQPTLSLIPFSSDKNEPFLREREEFQGAGCEQ